MESSITCLKDDTPPPISSTKLTEPHLIITAEHLCRSWSLYIRRDPAPLFFFMTEKANDACRCSRRRIKKAFAEIYGEIRSDIFTAAARIQDGGWMEPIFLEMGSADPGNEPDRAEAPV
jgi:hypothetical protein